MRLAALSLALGASAANAQDQPQPVPYLSPGETLLEVDATGTVLTRPDTVSFTAGVVTVGNSAQAALGENSAATQRLIATAKAAGIDGADLRTRALSVRPRFASEDRGEEEARIVGYEARNELSIQFRDLAKAPRVLSDLLAAGANNLAGPDFGLASDAGPLRAARARAVELAREKAKLRGCHEPSRGARAARIREVTADRPERLDRRHWGASGRIAIGTRRGQHQCHHLCGLCAGPRKCLSLIC